MSFEIGNVVGGWIHEGTVYRDNLARIIADVPDVQANRRWMKKFKARWKERFEQLEIWMISCPTGNAARRRLLV